MITWPSTLPKPETTFNGRFNTNAIRTRMDNGRVRQRKRFTSNLVTIPVSWKLTDDEFAFFQGIYHHLLNDGADWFTMSLPLGDGFHDYTARFVADTYAFAYDNVMHWKVTANLEVENVSPLTEAETEALMP